MCGQKVSGLPTRQHHCNKSLNATVHDLRAQILLRSLFQCEVTTDLFFLMPGIVHHDFIQQKQTVNEDFLHRHV